MGEYASCVQPLRRHGADLPAPLELRTADVRGRMGQSRAALGARWDEVKPEPFRLTREVVPGLYQVRTLGSRAYLAVEDEITIIDCGSPLSGTRVLDAVRELGRSVADVRDIVITHTHLDHVGALPEVQKHIPARTAVHYAEAGLLTSDKRLPNPVVHPWLAALTDGFFARSDPGAARVDLELDDGDELPVLGGLRVVHNPGHTAGSISLFFPERGVLIVGDALQFRFGRLMLPNRLFSEDLTQAGESVRKLALLDFETLCFSHFRPILAGADRKVRDFASKLAG